MPLSSKVIGEGSFGCVHKPTLECADKKLSYKNKISKVMLTKNAISELKEYAVISKVDKHTDFYLGLPETCRVKQSKYTIKSILKCKRLTKKNANITSKKQLNNMSLIILPDGGLNLKQYIEKIYNQTNKEKTIQSVISFWIECHRLFRGISVFQKHDIMHHDIKPQNIVYDEKKNRVNFIDFGHMRNIKKEIVLSRNSDTRSHPFWNYPFENQFLDKNNYMQFAKRSKKEKDQFYDNFISDLKYDRDTQFVNAFFNFIDNITEYMDINEKNKITNKYLQTFHKMIMNDITKTNYEKFLEKSLRTFDVFSLGMALQTILCYCNDLLDQTIIHSMEELFFNMMTPNVLQRYTIDEAMTKYETILQTFGATFENHNPI